MRGGCLTRLTFTEGCRRAGAAGRFMAGGAFKVLILAGRLNWDDGGWPLSPLLDRLERRGVSGPGPLPFQGERPDG